MTHWLLKTLPAEAETEVVFANTGEEHEETLEFVQKCDERLGFDVTWVEANVHHGQRKSCTHTVVDYATASRNGEPFEEVIQKYGIPNNSFPHCTRELKTNPIHSYITRECEWDDYWTAIGIRTDEIDRMSADWRDRRLVYPLCQHNPTAKTEINAFWAEMPFRLDLKGYQGNCKACWKKSFRKLLTIADEDPSAFENVQRWEQKYENHTPSTRKKNSPPYRFFRGGVTVEEILERAEEGAFRPARDDSTDTAVQSDLFGDLDRPGGGCDDHCEPFNT